MWLALAWVIFSRMQLLKEILVSSFFLFLQFFCCSGRILYYLKKILPRFFNLSAVPLRWFDYWCGLFISCLQNYVGVASVFLYIILFQMNQKKIWNVLHFEPRGTDNLHFLLSYSTVKYKWISDLTTCQKMNILCLVKLVEIENIVTDFIRRLLVLFCCPLRSIALELTWTYYVQKVNIVCIVKIVNIVQLTSPRRSLPVLFFNCNSHIIVQEVTWT